MLSHSMFAYIIIKLWWWGAPTDAMRDGESVDERSFFKPTIQVHSPENPVKKKAYITLLIRFYSQVLHFFLTSTEH